MKKHTIPYCGRTESSKRACGGCTYYSEEYCNYWDIHSPDECPYCNGTGYSYDGFWCEECYGTGEKL